MKNIFSENRLIARGPEMPVPNPEQGGFNEQHLTSAPMTPQEQKAYQEKQRNERLARWEKICQSRTAENLQLTVEDYQREIDRAQIRLRRGEIDYLTDRQAYQNVERDIFRMEEYRDIAWRVLQTKLGQQEKQHQQRLANYERSCQSRTAEDLQLTVEDYQMEISRAQIRLGRGEIDPRTQREAYQKMERDIFLMQEYRDIAWRVLQAKLKAANQ